MRKTKEQKAITLVALIITIVLLLILAVVSIRAVMGDGIIQHAENARNKNSQAQIEEEVKLALSELKIVEELTPMEKGEKIEWLENKLKASITDNDPYINIDYKGNKITIDSNFNIQDIFNASEWDKTSTPEDAFTWGSDDPTSPDYGKVTGYTAKAKELTTVKYPSRCTIISGIFKGGMEHIEKVEIPKTVTSICESAFHGGISLIECVIPESVTSIGHKAFCDCSSLKIIVPGSVLSVDSYAFRGCGTVCVTFGSEKERPSGWSPYWYYSSGKVVYNYAGEEI